MTIRWLEAEAKLRVSVPLEAVERLRDDVMKHAPAALHDTFERFFEDVHRTR